MKSEVKPLQSANAAQRCIAWSKRKGFLDIHSLSNLRVCRMHGAGSGQFFEKEYIQYILGLRSTKWKEQKANQRIGAGVIVLLLTRECLSQNVMASIRSLLFFVSITARENPFA